MNNTEEELATLPTHILQLRIEALEAEWYREKAKMPNHMLTLLSMTIAIFCLGLSLGFSSVAFILMAVIEVGFVLYLGVGIWGLLTNLRDSKAALGRIAG